MRHGKRASERASKESKHEDGRSFVLVEYVGFYGAGESQSIISVVCVLIEFLQEICHCCAYKGVRP